MVTMDESGLLVSAAAVVLLCQAVRYVTHKRKKRKIWMKKCGERHNEGRGIVNKLNEELKVEDVDAYTNFLGLNRNQFNKLLDLVKPLINRDDLEMQQFVSAQSKLEVTLRFLTTGETYRSLMYSTRVHESMITKFVPEVCSAIVKALQGKYLQTPTTSNEWEKIAADFNDLWHFPHCLGALDGRLIKYRLPQSAGSCYNNGKDDHSIVLLAMSDALYRFTYVNIRGICDGGIFRDCSLSKCLANNSLNLPASRPLPGATCDAPYVVLADETFPLSTSLLKPYPQRELTYECRIFNYRLSRARGVIDNAFGILANRFRVLQNSISLAPNKVQTITLACVALHNYLATENWSNHTKVNQDTSLKKNLEKQGGNRPPNAALRTREEFKNYFSSVAGRVEWQDTALV